MDAGQMDTPIIFQTLNKSSDGTGGFTESWSDKDTVFAQKLFMNNNRMMDAGQEQQYTRVKFRMWKDNFIINSAGETRIKEVETGNIYKIYTFHELQKKFVDIICEYAQNSDSYE